MWLTFLAPTQLTLARRDTNSLVWSYEPLDNLNDSFVYEVVNETSHLATCDKSVKLCKATGLMAGTIYKVSLIVCFNTSAKAEVCSEKSVSVVSVTSPNSKFIPIVPVSSIEKRIVSPLKVCEEEID